MCVCMCVFRESEQKVKFFFLIDDDGWQSQTRSIQTEVNSHSLAKQKIRSVNINHTMMIIRFRMNNPDEPVSYRSCFLFIIIFFGIH